MMTISVNSAAGAKGNEANFVTDANGNVVGLAAPNSGRYSLSRNASARRLNSTSGFVSAAGTVIDDGTGSYTGASDWTGYTTANDTNYRKLGTSCTKLTVTGTPGTYVRITKDYGSPSFTIASGDKVTVWVYCPAAESGGFSLYVSPDGTWTNHYYANYSGSYLRKGWNAVTWKTSDFTTVGSPSWGSLRMWRVVFAVTNSAYPTIYFGGIVNNQAARPKILLGFDDGFDSVRSRALPIMREYGLVGYQSLIGKLIGRTNYSTAAQIDELYDAGWDILVHGPAPGAANNLYDWATQAEMEDDILYNQSTLLANGWLRGNDIYVYPEGVWMQSGSPGDTMALDAVIATGMRAARIANNGTAGSGNGEYSACGVGNPHLIRGQNIGTNTVSTLLANLDNCISKGRTYSIFTHDILATNNPGGVGGSAPADGNTYYLDDFELLCQSIAARVAQGLVDCISMTEFVDHCVRGY